MIIGYTINDMRLLGASENSGYIVILDVTNFHGELMINLGITFSEERHAKANKDMNNGHD